MALDASVPQEPDEVLGVLRAHGVGRALTTHSWSEEYDPSEGNARMADLSRSHAEFEPCAVLVPEFAGDDLPARLVAWGARAVRLRPGKHSFSLTPAVSDEVLGQLAEMRVPVFLCLDETNWAALDGVLTRHPSLRLMLECVGYRHARSLFPMLGRYEGLHVSTASLVGHRAIEALAERFGSDRLLFGTGFPDSTPGPAVTRLLLAEIPDESKAAIGAANLERLLSEAALP